MITISDQILTSLSLPLDSKLSNVIISGSNIIVETKNQYLARVDVDSRPVGMEVSFVTPSGIFPIPIFLNKAKSGELTATKYKFNASILDAAFSVAPEVINSGHIIKTDTQTLPTRSKLSFSGFKLEDDEENDATKVSNKTLESDIFITKSNNTSISTQLDLIPNNLNKHSLTISFINGTHFNFPNLNRFYNGTLILKAENTLSNRGTNQNTTFLFNNNSQLLLTKTDLFIIFDSIKFVKSNVNQSNIIELGDTGTLITKFCYWDFSSISLKSFSISSKGAKVISNSDTFRGTNNSINTGFVLVGKDFDFGTYVHIHDADYNQYQFNYMISGVGALGYKNSKNAFKNKAENYSKIVDLTPENNSAVVTLTSPTLNSIIMGATSATLSWDDPNSNPQELGIIVYYKLSNSSNWTPVITLNPGTTTYQVSNLMTNQSYDFRVQALGDKVTFSFNDSTPSNILSGVVGVPLPQFATPTLILDIIGETSLTFNYSPFLNVGSPRMEISDDGISGWTFVDRFILDPPGVYTVSDLTSGVLKYFRLRINGNTTNSSSDYSSIISGTPELRVSSPIITLEPIGAPNSTTYLFEGAISYSLGHTIMDYGFVYNTTPNPTINNTVIDSSGFSYNFYRHYSDFEPSTLYHIRAYVTTDLGTYYSSERSFTTSSLIISTPSVITLSPTVGDDNVTLFGSSTDLGGEPAAAHGFVYGNNLNPSLADGVSSNISLGVKSQTGLFSYFIDTITLNVEYHYRAYITNSVGTVYGNDFTFTVVPSTLPQMNTPIISILEISYDGIKVGYEVEFGTDPIPRMQISEDGVNWQPVIRHPQATEGEYYASSIPANSLRYFRMLFDGDGINYSDSDWSNIINATTLPDTITVETLPITNIQLNSGGDLSGTFNANLTNIGNSPITGHGFVYSTNSPPTINDTIISSSGNGSIGTFTGLFNNLSTSIIYYIRAYVINSQGVNYGNEISQVMELPSLVTSYADTIMPTSVRAIGGILSFGGSPITSYGFVYSTSPNPTILDNVFYGQLPASVGTMYGVLEGLTQVTDYYIRSFAVNSIGVNYGPEVLTRTSTNVANTPSVVVQPVTDITSTSATFNAVISGNGGGNILSHGFNYGTTTDVLTTINNGPSELSLFQNTVTGLQQGMTYYVNAFASNEFGEFTTQIISFIAQDASIPIVTTQEASLITSSTARLHANVLEGSDLIIRGFVMGSTINPTLSDTVINTGVPLGLGIYASDVSGLIPGNTYHVRAYATNNVGTSYGDNISFTMIGELEDVIITTQPITNIGATVATINWTIVSIGANNFADLSSGYCYNITPNPTISDLGSSGNLSELGSISSINGSFSPETTYYIRPYVTNGVDVTYGPEVNFTTAVVGTIILPDIDIVDLSSNTGTETSILLTGLLFNNGGEELTTQGFVMGINTNPTTSDTLYTTTLDGAAWSTSVVNLVAETTYYIRAFATNSAGTVYSRNITYTPEALPLSSWYGSMLTLPTTENDITSLVSTNDNTFTINTGNTNLYHIVAIEDSKTLVSVIDQDPFPIPVTNNYELSQTLTSINGNPYKVYILTIAIPYSSNHRHIVTLS